MGGAENAGQAMMATAIHLTRKGICLMHAKPVQFKHGLADRYKTSYAAKACVDTNRKPHRKNISFSLILTV